MAILTMLRRFAILLWILMTLSCAQATELTTLAYHDIVSGPGSGPYGVSRSMFVAQMDYLKQNGYHPINLDLLRKVQAGKARLPDKAILLSFDDGLRSYADFVVPTLKIYGYPSAVAVVGVWADGTRVPPEYQGRMMSWNELRRLRDTPLVEIISHSHDLHRGIPSNPQGNEDAATVTRQYFNGTHTYESEIDFRNRIRSDLTQSVAEFRHHLGFAPRAIAWPYGYYDQVLVEEMRRAGIHFYLTLENGPTPVQQLPRIRRILVRNTPSLSEFADDLHYKYRLVNQRVVEFSLDPFKSVNDSRQEELLSRLLNQLQFLHVNTVIVSPFTDDHREAFFYNHQMPVASNVLNRVLHQILIRLHMQRIYLSLPSTIPVADVRDLYTDLTRLNWFSGVLFETLPTEKLESQIRHIVAYYHPIAKFGLIGLPPADRQYDFNVIRLDAGLSRLQIEQRVTMLRHQRFERLVVLGCSSNEDEHELAARLQLLRRLGVINYGFGPDDYVTAPSADNLLASEMTVIPATGKVK
ncbi:MAG: polysaccharide deacetylase family protein [Sulfuricaulis sp.]